MARVLIVGVGNRHRGDDAVGPLVAERLRQPGMVADGITVCSHSGEAASLLELWSTADATILVDASAPAGEPGRIRRIDVSEETLPLSGTEASSHELGPAQTIELARALGSLPRRAIVYAVEGAHFDLGRPLSPAVAITLATLARRVADEAVQLTGDTACTNAP